MAAAGTHSPGGPNGIIRSQSFAGFSTLQEKRSRCNSFMGNSVAQKKPASKPKKPHLSGHKGGGGGGGGGGSREPQPRRLEEVYNALRRGLDEYLEVHQTELDKLTFLMKDMKRNSRLGVLYDLDKQIKAIERYMRRLEFHMSKVDELYEAFCIQSRLRDGAGRMKQAFTSSPSTKATKESVAEVNRRYKEYTENMSAFESDLENLLGEFHIKMKGLAGFARLCPGDQYEIFMRYGRQRWKLKGRIEVNSRQSWDGDEMIFVPLVSDFINIKVTELKGLATHLLVGSVTCETKDLFTAAPQAVAVDVNDLGTVKLNLEVAWYPFDVEDLTLSSGNVSKATALQRRVSVYSQGTPETPTFQDAAFFSTLPDDVFENGGSADCQRLSFAFSDASCPSPAPSSHSPAPSNPEITVTPPDTDASPSPAGPREGSIAEEDEDGEEDGGDAVAPEDVFLDHADQLKPVQLEQDDDGGGNLTRQLVKRLTSTDEEGGGCGPAGGGALEDAVHGLLLTLEALTQRCRELQDLEQEVMRLEDLLKCRLPGRRSRSSSLSLTVESALESFDFLNTSDFDDDDTGDVVLATPPLFDGDRNGGQHPEARGHPSEALTEDTGVGNSVAGSPLPLTTGNDNLDAALVVHLQYCQRLIQMLSDAAPCRRRRVLLKLSSQTALLEELAEVIADRPGAPPSPAEAVAGLAARGGLLALWAECSGSAGLFHTTLERVVDGMTRRYRETLAEKYPRSCHTAIALVAREMADRNDGPEPDPASDDPTRHPVTVFQFHAYAAERQVGDMETHLLHLAEEGEPPTAKLSMMINDNTMIAQEILQSWRINCSPQKCEICARSDSFSERLVGGDAHERLSALREVPAWRLWPRGATLRTLASLLTSDDPDVSEAASAYLAAEPTHGHFRNKAVECYTEALSEEGVRTRMAACAALGCLQAAESVRAVAALCDSADDDLRRVAIETLLTLGEEGRLAYEQLDTVPREMIHLGGRRANAVSTTF